jgi:hypothetical protein
MVIQVVFAENRSTKSALVENNFFHVVLGSSARRKGFGIVVNPDNLWLIPSKRTTGLNNPRRNEVSLLGLFVDHPHGISLVDGRNGVSVNSISSCSLQIHRDLDLGRPRFL